MSGALSLSKIVLSILLACVFSRTSCAALLAEIGINVPPAFDASPPPSDSILFRFDVSTPNPPAVSGAWGRQVIASDLGVTYDASQQMVDSFARALARLDSEVSIRVHDIAYSRRLESLQNFGWELPAGLATFQKYVPDITKVPVNRLTMTIDSFHFERLGGVVPRANIGGGHTIRIYGVPEPASCIRTCIGSMVSIRRFGR